MSHKGREPSGLVTLEMLVLEGEATLLPKSSNKRLTEKVFRITITQHHLRKVEALEMMKALYQKTLCCMMIVIFPAALFAADQPDAMFYSHGTALLNGNSIATSSAIFSGDMVQTNVNSVANINATGSTVLVMNDSLVRYEGSSVKLERGGLAVSTSKLLATRAGDVTVSPSASAWTEFEVKDMGGKVLIAARKGDLTISDDAGTTTLAQGQETTRQDTSTQSDDGKQKKSRKKGGGKNGENAPAAAEGGILNTAIAVGVGAAAIGGITAWALSGSSKPASPAKP